MAFKKKTIEDRLRKAGLRCTPGRMAILQLFASVEKPLTQDEIASKLLKNKGLNKTTIYRALECFFEKGIVHRAFVHDRIWHYELPDHCEEKQCHPHFYCYNCRITKCLHNVHLPMATGLEEGFEIQHQQVRLEGLCPECSYKIGKRKRVNGS